MQAVHGANKLIHWVRFMEMACLHRTRLRRAAKRPWEPTAFCQGMGAPLGATASRPGALPQGAGGFSRSPSGTAPEVSRSSRHGQRASVSGDRTPGAAADIAHVSRFQASGIPADKAGKGVSPKSFTRVPGKRGARSCLPVLPPLCDSRRAPLRVASGHPGTFCQRGHRLADLASCRACLGM